MRTEENRCSKRAERRGSRGQSLAVSYGRSHPLTGLEQKHALFARVALSGFSDRRYRPFRINVIITPAALQRSDATSSPPVACSPHSRDAAPRPLLDRSNQVCSAWSCAASWIRFARASIGTRSSPSSGINRQQLLEPSRACAATTPSSAKCARNALIGPVAGAEDRGCDAASADFAARPNSPAQMASSVGSRLADRLRRVGRIVLVALDVSLRRHRSNPCARAW